MKFNRSLFIACVGIMNLAFAHLCAGVSSAYKVMAVVIPSYNNEQWCIKNLTSVLIQKYPQEYVKIIIVNDASTDRTRELLETCIDEYALYERVKLINNSERKGALANLNYMIREFCEPTDVVLTLDGDDWFVHDQVFNTINQAYQDPNVWVTYGQHIHFPTKRRGVCKPMPPELQESGNIRDVPWFCSHLRTFYAGLFHKINEEDLLWNGEFYPVTWDQAMMYPMLEMARGRVKFISNVLYVYNFQNPLSEFRVRPRLEILLSQEISKKEPYKPIDYLFECEEYVTCGGV